MHYSVLSVSAPSWFSLDSFFVRARDAWIIWTALNQYCPTALFLARQDLPHSYSFIHTISTDARARDDRGFENTRCIIRIRRRRANHVEDVIFLSSKVQLPRGTFARAARISLELCARHYSLCVYDSSFAYLSMRWKRSLNVFPPPEGILTRERAVKYTGRNREEVPFPRRSFIKGADAWR